MPVILEALRSGQVHPAGLRLLAPHLTPENQEHVLAEAAGKSKRQIEDNQHAAEKMYGPLFMERARASVDRPALEEGIPPG